MEPEQLKALVKALEEINNTINNNHNDGGFKSETTSCYKQLDKLIKKIKGIK